MIAWNTSIDGNCVLCNQHLEIRNHIFFECSYTSLLWHKLMSGIMGNNYTEEWNAILAFKSQLKLLRAESFLTRYVFQSAVYMILRKRNSRNHGENPRPLENLFRTIDKIRPGNFGYRFGSSISGFG